jgi:DNA mismatch repair protein MutH
MEVWKEEWEESDLLQQLDRMLIVPLVRSERKTPKEKQVWGHAFFWSPTSDQLAGIECEWRDYGRRIQAGEANRLPGASQTKYIHVRPHARDSSDTEQAPRVGQVVKKCFWLNQDFIATIVEENSGIPKSLRGS